MVSVQIMYLECKPATYVNEEIVGPKLALARIPCAEEEIIIPEDGDKLGSGKLHRVIFVRHLAELIPVIAQGREEWPPRAEIGVIPA